MRRLPRLANMFVARRLWYGALALGAIQKRWRGLPPTLASSTFGTADPKFPRRGLCGRAAPRKTSHLPASLLDLFLVRRLGGLSFPSLRQYREKLHAGVFSDKLALPRLAGAACVGEAGLEQKLNI